MSARLGLSEVESGIPDSFSKPLTKELLKLSGGGDLLEKLLRDQRPMSERVVAAEVALPCLRMLRALHEMHIIHRWVGTGGGGCLLGEGQAAVVVLEQEGIGWEDGRKR